MSKTLSAYSTYEISLSASIKRGKKFDRRESTGARKSVSPAGALRDVRRDARLSPPGACREMTGGRRAGVSCARARASDPAWGEM